MNNHQKAHAERAKGLRTGVALTQELHLRIVKRGFGVAKGLEILAEQFGELIELIQDEANKNEALSQDPGVTDPDPDSEDYVQQHRDVLVCSGEDLGGSMIRAKHMMAILPLMDELEGLRNELNKVAASMTSGLGFTPEADDAPESPSMPEGYVQLPPEVAEALPPELLARAKTLNLRTGEVSDASSYFQEREGKQEFGRDIPRE